MASTTSRISTTAPSAISRRPKPFRPELAHVRITGATTSTPAASPSVHVRNTLPRSSGEITSPSRSAAGPNAALTSAATSAHATNASTSVTRSSEPRPFVRRRSSIAAATSATVFPSVCARTVPSRRREVAEEQVADHDPRPQPHPVEEQDREAQARRRPQRGDRAVQVGQLEPDPAGEVVRQRGERERARVEDRRVQAVRADSAEAPSAHGIVPTLVRAVRQRTPSR